MNTVRTDALASEAAFEVMAAAQHLEAVGRKVLHLEIGQPEVATPAHIVEAAVCALRAGQTRYAPSAGLPELREAIAAHLAQRGVDVRAENVVVTSGAKPMIFYAALAVLGSGDEALVPDPGFPIYASVARFAGARPVRYPLDPTGSYTIDPDAVAERITRRTRLLMLNSPNNPTGGIVAGDTLRRIAELADKHGLLVLSDEVYGRLVYDGPHESIAALPGLAGRTILVDSFSKTYAMTGWRLGYGVMPEWLIGPVTRLVINSTSCAPPFVQYGGLAALTGGQECVRAWVNRLREKRALIVQGLNAISGVRCTMPAGTFYAFPDVSEALTRTGTTVEEFARRLLTEEGVATLPGSGFGLGGTGHIRLSYTTSPWDLKTALDRIRRCISGLAATK